MSEKIETIAVKLPPDVRDERVSIARVSAQPAIDVVMSWEGNETIASDEDIASLRPIIAYAEEVLFQTQQPQLRAYIETLKQYLNSNECGVLTRHLLHLQCAILCSGIETILSTRKTCDYVALIRQDADDADIELNHTQQKYARLLETNGGALKCLRDQLGDISALCANDGNRGVEQPNVIPLERKKK